MYKKRKTDKLYYSRNKPIGDKQMGLTSQQLSRNKAPEKHLTWNSVSYIVLTKQVGETFTYYLWADLVFKKTSVTCWRLSRPMLRTGGRWRAPFKGRRHCFLWKVVENIVRNVIVMKLSLNFILHWKACCRNWSGQRVSMSDTQMTLLHWQMCFYPRTYLFAHVHKCVSNWPKNTQNSTSNKPKLH